MAKQRGTMRLVAVDAGAAALGLTPGLTLADARVRVPDLTVVAQDAVADAAWLERLADACLRYSPQVALDPPDGLILDIAGCGHPFGGPEALAADLVARLDRIGMTTTHALAATPDAARALARHGVGRKETGSHGFATPPFPDGGPGPDGANPNRLPVVALRLGEERTTALLRAGLKTVGDLACRPLAGIAARFGADAVHALRRMTGEVDSPLVPHRVPPAIQVERRFAEPIASTDYALAVLAELAGEACAALERRDHGGRAFTALFFRSDGQVRRLAVETGVATRDPPAIMRLFRERIAGLDDPLDPGFGYDLVQFAVSRSQALSVRQATFDGPTGDSEIAALVDRLSTRLGRARLRRFVPGDSHLPERAQRLVPAIDGPAQGGWGPVEIGEPPLRPLHMFDPPQSIEAIAEVPDGPPLRFRWRSHLHDVTRFEGPERIAAEWWRRRDGTGLTRDYYRVEDSCGRRFWIFRHGLYGDEAAMPGWYLHGLFA